MAATKTRPTGASIDAYLASRASPGQLADCKAIMAMCKRVTKQAPRMWGPSIVGFDTYHYKYASGHEGDSCMLGFSSRKADITLYLIPGFSGVQDLLAELGTHKTGKACLYIKRLSDVQLPVLEALLTRAYAEARRMYPRGGE